MPYAPIHLAEPQYVNGTQIGQLIQGGKLPLSLEQAIELALQNNPDIAIQRYNSWIAETDILRAKGGGAQRGVGGAVTTATAFGDVPTVAYDPTLELLASVDSRLIPANNPLTSGVGTSAATVQSVGTHTETGDFIYNQGFHTGTSITLTLDNTRSTTSSSAVFYNPLVQSTGTLLVNQPLLNGFGLLTNERYIRIAVITKKAVDYAFQQSLLTDITTVEDDYWELVYARGNVDVQQQAVTEAQQLYDDNKRQVEVGTLAPLEIVRAEAQLATAQQGLIVAQTAQLQQQIILMSVIAKDPNAPELRNIEIVPTDTTQTPPQMEDIPLTDAINEAITNRPDVLDSKINIDADDINVKVARNGLLPSLNASAYVTSTGEAGNSKITTSTPGTGTAIEGPGDSAVEVLNTVTGLPTTLILPNTVTTTTGVTPGGLGSDLGTLFRGKYPEYEAQITLTVPIRNRVAQADSMRALLTQRQDVAKYQQVINGVAVDVHNAQVTLQQDRAAVIAAQKAAELQKETLDADEKRLAAGAGTNFVVVTDQQNLAAAGSAEVRAEVNLVEAQVNFERAMGRTLSAKHITVANAFSGTVPRDTQIPGTAPNGELLGMKQILASLPNSR
jgi:outer membrane protein